MDSLTDKGGEHALEKFNKQLNTLTADIISPGHGRSFDLTFLSNYELSVGGLKTLWSTERKSQTVAKI